MNYKIILIPIFFVSLLYLVGCGVKADPLPPLHPTHIGRGKPTFKRALEQMENESDENRDKDKEKPIRKRRFNP